MTLRETLERFERTLTAGPSAHERVAVDVSRQDGFTHRAVTPRGLKVVLDEPVAFGGNGSAPDPAEYLLAAVGASLSVTLTAHATLRGVVIDDVRVHLSAAIDGHAFFHPDAGGKAGLLDTALTLTIVSDAPKAALRGVVRDALRVAPVLRTLKRMPRVTIVIEPARAA